MVDVAIAQAQEVVTEVKADMAVKVVLQGACSDTDWGRTRVRVGQCSQHSRPLHHRRHTLMHGAPRQCRQGTQHPPRREFPRTYLAAEVW